MRSRTRTSVAASCWRTCGCSSPCGARSDSATALVPLLIGLAVLTAPPRWRTLLLGSLPALALLPWVHQLVRSLDELDVTKTGGGYLTVTPASIRAQLVTLIYGETGHGAG